MLHALIGHRGVGKTALLHRIAAYYRDCGIEVITLDLDVELERRTGESVAELFARRKEDGFRAEESATLHALIAEYRERAECVDVYIAIGAGFAGKIPSGINVVWVRRPTDVHGRIFIGRERPRLRKDVPPLDEYLERFPLREQRYAASHRQVVTLLEGMAQPSALEKMVVQSILATPAIAPTVPVGGILSLLPENFRSAGIELDFPGWIARRLAWQGTRFELRDDILHAEELALAQSLIPPWRRIHSFRRAPPAAEFLAAAALRGEAWDYPLEFGIAAAPNRPPILSLHERQKNESLEAAALRLQSAGAHLSAQILKLAVEVQDFAELEAGWAWAMAEPWRRAFLPRSPRGMRGRWRWFRLVFGRRMPLAFFREGDGTSLDQPLLFEWLQTASQTSPHFAAVLGDPIDHSRTPVEHAAFFAARGMPVVAVKLDKREWEAGALSVLHRLGLRYAAVTSPLKHAAAALSTPEALPKEPAWNTLFFCERTHRYSGTNTDAVGAEALLGPLRGESQIAIFGGGGTLEVLKTVLPRARLFAARTGKLRSGQNAAEAPPTVLVFAAASTSALTFPDPAWRPRIVVDLNYSEHSKGREYALQVGAEYVSGLAMFKAQAAAQRAFWESCERAQ